MTAHPHVLHHAGVALQHTPSKGSYSPDLAWPVRRALDDMLASYIEWREAAAAVDDAYARCSVARDGEHAGRFSAYLAALDQEEASAANYSRSIVRVEGLL